MEGATEGWNEGVAGELVGAAVDGIKRIWYAKDGELTQKERMLKTQLERGMDMMWTKYHVRGEPALRVVIAEPLAIKILSYFGISDTPMNREKVFDVIIDAETADIIERHHQKDRDAKGGGYRGFVKFIAREMGNQVNFWEQIGWQKKYP